MKKTEVSKKCEIALGQSTNTYVYSIGCKLCQSWNKLEFNKYFFPVQNVNRNEVKTNIEKCID